MALFTSLPDGSRLRSRDCNPPHKARRGPGHSWSTASRRSRMQLAPLVEQLETRQLLSGLTMTATGGSAISADNSLTGPATGWTTLTGPVYTETGPQRFGSSGNVILDAPTGFN